MTETLKKCQSQIIKPPFLSRFTGKLNQLSKQGILTHQSQALNESAIRKHKPAILIQNGENSLMSLDQIRHKNQDEFQSNLLHLSVHSAAEQPGVIKSDSVY